MPVSAPAGLCARRGRGAGTGGGAAPLKFARSEGGVARRGRRGRGCGSGARSQSGDSQSDPLPPPAPEASLPRSLWNPLGFRIFAGENASSLRLLHPFGGEEEAQSPLSAQQRLTFGVHPWKCFSFDCCPLNSILSWYIRKRWGRRAGLLGFPFLFIFKSPK